MERIGLVTILGIVALLAAPLAAEGPADAINTEQLAETLNEMQMSVLLEAMAEATGDKALKVDLLLQKARAAGEPERTQLYVQAADLCKQVAEDAEDDIRRYRDAETFEETSAYEDAAIRHFRYRLKYITIYGLNLAQPYFDRINYLAGSDEDRKVLVDLTQDAVKGLRRLDVDLIDFRDRARDPKYLVFLMPTLETIGYQARYDGARIRYYNAVALPKVLPADPKEPQAGQRPNEERNGLLEDAIVNLRLFVEKPDFGLQADAHLWTGRCQRELGEFAEAIQSLESAMAPGIRAGTRMDALFEQARAMIDWGVAETAKSVDAGNAKFQEAEALIDRFSEKGVAIVGTSRERDVDGRQLLLAVELYDQWSQALAKANQADASAERRKGIAKAFSVFLEKYRDDPGVVTQVVGMIISKYGGENIDITQFSPFVQVAFASHFISVAIPLQAGDSAQKAEAEKKLDRAGEILLALKEDASPEGKEVQGDVHWLLGVLYARKGDNFKAADAFREVVAKYPDHPHAYDAALSAVQVIRKLLDIRRGEGADTTPVLQEYVKSLEVMLQRFGDREDAAKYQFDLGWAYERLAGREPDPAASRKLLVQARDAYGKVPASSPYAENARYYSLDVAYKLMIADGEKADKADAQSLVVELTTYGADVHPAWEKAEGDRKEELGEWGSTAEFHAQVLNIEILKLMDGPVAKIRALSQRWPGTRILQPAQAFLIRSLLNDGKVTEGLDEFRAFEDKYGQEQAHALMDEVAAALRSEIQHLRRTSSEKETLQTLRDAYLKLAEQIYALNPASTPAEKPAATMLYADALVQSGVEANARKAQELYQTLDDVEKAAHQRWFDRVAKVLDPLEKQIADAGSDPQRLIAAGKEFWKTADELGLSDWAAKSDTAQGLRRPLDDLSAGKGDVRNVRLALNAAVRKLRDETKRRITVNPLLLRGRAKTLMALGEYAEASKLLVVLTMGLQSSGGSLYWEAELDLLRSLLEANRDQPQQLKQVLVRLSQLRRRNPGLGGEAFLGQFNALESEIRKAAGS